MKILSKEFGELEVKDEDIINFNRSIFGFEGKDRFVILKDSPEDDIMYLQSIDDENLHFVVVDPYAILPNYKPKISSDDIAELKIKKADISDLRYLLIAIIAENIENSVVNLKNPLVINSNNKQAIQAMLENEDYVMRHPLFSDNEAGDTSC
jgi:flagellar assembly factor FliW